MENDGRILRVGILADVHVWTKYPFRAWKLNRALRDMKRLGVDAFLSLGDTTDHGDEDQWKAVTRCFARHAPCRDLIIAIGNHDTWTHCPEGTVHDERSRISTGLYMKYRDLISGRDNGNKVYYDHVVKGLHFICIGSEGDDLNAYISDGQTAWLRETMKTAAADGKPVFVSCHQAFNRTHGLPVTFDREPQKDVEPDRGGIGPRSDEIKEILSAYSNVFFFSGHSHMGLVNSGAYSTCETVDGIHSFNLPCYMFGNHHGVPDSGYGYIMDVYADRVEFKARNFSLRRYNGDFDYTVKLK